MVSHLRPLLLHHFLAFLSPAFQESIHWMLSAFHVHQLYNAVIPSLSSSVTGVDLFLSGILQSSRFYPLVCSLGSPVSPFIFLCSPHFQVCPIQPIVSSTWGDFLCPLGLSLWPSNLDSALFLPLSPFSVRMFELAPLFLSRLAPM